MKKSFIIGGIIVLVLIVGGYFYFLNSSTPTQLVGDEILEVKVTLNNGVPFGKIEVDLWKAGSEGVPDAGFSFTNDEGVAIFNIPDGEYEIGFNLNNFPDNLEYPEKTFVLVEKGVPAYKTILISAKQD